MMTAERGGDRRLTRWAMTLVLVLDLVMLYWGHFFEPPLPEVLPYEPQFLVDLHGESWLLILLGVIAVGGLTGFVLRRRPITSGIVALLAIGLLNESYTAVVDSPRRMFFTTGAMLMGWVVGLAFARQRGADPDRSERLAEWAAIGGLAATYVGAGIQKMFNGALFESSSLRAHIYNHHPVGGTTIFDDFSYWVAETPAASEFLSVSVVFIQLSAFALLISPGWRAVSGALLISFHLGTLFFMDIIYLEATVMLLVIAVPWHRMRWPGASRKDVEAAPQAVAAVSVPTVGLSTAARSLAVALGVVAIAMVIPVPHYVERPGVHPEEHVSNRPGDIRAIGPIVRRQNLGEWTVVDLRLRKGEALMSLERPDVPGVRMAFRPAVDGDRPTPWSGDGVHIYFYRTDVDPKQLDSAGKALLHALVTEVKGPNLKAAVASWLAKPDRY